MSRERNLIKNTAILSIGTIIPKLIAILITPILTGKLTKAEYGQYDLVLTLAALLLPAITLQISSAAFRFLIDWRDNENKCKSIISTIILFVISISIITGIAFSGIGYSRFGLLGIVVSLYFLIDILFIAIQQIVRGLGHNLLYAISSIIYSIINCATLVLLLGVVLSFNLGLFGVLISLIFSCLVGGLFLFIKGELYKYIDVKYATKEQLKELLSYSWPMVPNNLSDWVLRLSDRLVIIAVLGVEANAVYAVANKMPTIFSSFQTTFTLAWQENASLASQDSDKDAYYTQMCNGVFRILYGIMGLLISCSPILWGLLIRGDYSDAYKQLPILYMAILFSCMASTLGGIYIAYKKTKSVGITTTIAAVINLVIDLLFVRVIGIYAGSISTLIAYLFLLVYRIKDVQKIQTIYFDYLTMISGIIIIYVMCLLMYLDYFMTNIVNCALGIIVLLAFDRKIIKTMFITIKNKISHLRYK